MAPVELGKSAAYAKVREMILLYDALTTRRSEQMVLGTEATAGGSDGPTPMEVDSVQSKGKSKGGKGKSKDKDGSKGGKSKGKSKGKENKGKGKFYDRKGCKGSGSDRSKGKGKSDSKTRYASGKSGHFARDCWQAPQGSQQSQQQPVNPTPVTQYKSFKKFGDFKDWRKCSINNMKIWFLTCVVLALQVPMDA